MRNRTRIATTIATLVVAAFGAATASAADTFVPGHSDFPNVLRIQDEQFVPGHTDFPSRLGSGAGARRSVTPALAESGPAFDWADPGVGAMGAFALVLIAGGTAVALRSRTSSRLS